MTIEPIKVENYAQCGGCGRFLLEKRTLSIKEIAGTSLAETQYLFRPWAARVLTRVKEIPLPEGNEVHEAEAHGRIVKMLDVAYACCTACIEKVIETWTYDAERTELRALPEQIHIGISKLDGRDIVIPALGSRWPAPEHPSDEWIDSGVLRAAKAARVWP